ncbi:MAG: arginase family protein, partial [Bacteroidota bacterium]
MRTIKLIKNRSDLGAGTRGSDMGIDAIEIAAINKDDDYFNCYPYEDIATVNETIYNKVNNSFAKRIGCVLKVCTRLSKSVKNSLKDNNFPIVLSGDHSSAIGSISGIKAAYPEKRLGVVWIDAHADIHSPFTSPSGNIHGMSLAAVLNDDNLDHRINNVFK